MDKKKILICDDEENIRKSLKLILSDKYDTAVAENGEEAIRKIHADPDIKVVLLDIKMPGKNGLDVLKEIKSYKKISIVIVTGYQSVETAAEFVKAGAAHYITKPFESEDVLETIEKAIS